MLIRIVHMYFTTESAEKFLEIFNESAGMIRNMEGCTRLELLHDIDDGNHYSTLSHWYNAAHLDHYRNSPLFRNVWGRVKPLFVRKPVAYSMYAFDDNSRGAYTDSGATQMI
jgi:(4S)-4-hydroxy-5-phosphonooxypentane-2,3-dione isomerase